MEPACAANTNSLMSTNPPTAVMIPSVISSGFKGVLDLLELLRVRSKFSRRGAVRRTFKPGDFLSIARLGLRQRLGRRLELFAQAPAHCLHIRSGEMALVGLFVDE